MHVLAPLVSWAQTLKPHRFADKDWDTVRLNPTLLMLLEVGQIPIVGCQHDRHTLRCMPLRCATLRAASPLHRAACRYAALRGTACRCDTLRYAALRCATLRYAALRCATLRDAALHAATLRYAALRRAPLRYAALRFAALRDPALHAAALWCTTPRPPPIILKRMILRDCPTFFLVL